MEQGEGEERVARDERYVSLSGLRGGRTEKRRRAAGLASSCHPPLQARTGTHLVHSEHPVELIVGHGLFCCCRLGRSVWGFGGTILYGLAGQRAIQECSGTEYSLRHSFRQRHPLLAALEPSLCKGTSVFYCSRGSRAVFYFLVRRGEVGQVLSPSARASTRLLSRYIVYRGSSRTRRW